MSFQLIDWELPIKQPTAFAVGYLMGETGFEPVKAYASRFTVCPLCPLGYSPYSLEYGILPAPWSAGKGYPFL